LFAKKKIYYLQNIILIYSLNVKNNLKEANFKAVVFMILISLKELKLGRTSLTLKLIFF